VEITHELEDPNEKTTREISILPNDACTDDKPQA
jgi:hypothetical protein